VCRDWNERGVTTSSGGEWVVTSLRTVLAGARIAGLRVHRGEIVGPAVWPAIIDRATHERLRALLADPRRRQKGRPAARLLTGLLCCGRPDCGAVLHSSVRAADGARRWTCTTGPGKPACGRLAVVDAPLEELVVEAVLQHLERPVTARLGVADDGDSVGADGLLDQLADDERRLEELAEMFASGELSRAQLLAGTERLRTRVEESRAALGRLERDRVLADLPTDGSALRDAWAAGSLEWRRAVLAAVVESVVIAPAARPGVRRLDPARVTIRYR
jgi:site-specific DNA recombinase